MTVKHGFWLCLITLMGHSLQAQGPVKVAHALAQPKETASVYESYALTNQGDIQNGQKLFLNEAKTQCVTCHRMGNVGGTIGPNLSGIGGKFDRPHLIDALLNPSREIVEGYHVTQFAMLDGHVVSGIVKAENQAEAQLIDVKSQWHRVNKSEVEERQVSRASIMPEDLEKSLTKEEFTDLVAFLESSRTGGYSPGDSIAGAYQFPSGFVVRNVATGLTAATSIEVLADGRIMICEQTGNLRLVKDGELLEEPVLKMDVERNRERGLLGVTVHPLFPSVPYVYTCQVLARPYTHHRISRWTMTGDTINPETEVVLLEGDNQRMMGGTDPASAQGGGMHFGSDGCLYISIGEQTSPQYARSLNSLLGKILRINADGSIPEDNPFYERTQGKYRSIWAIGLRNPYSFTMRPNSKQLVVTDVGGNYEEVNLVEAGNDMGWPAFQHGPVRGDQFKGPFHYYARSCICGAAFAPDNWPEEIRGKFLFTDFIHGWVRAIDPDEPETFIAFGERLRRPVDLRTTQDGTLYILMRNAWVLDSMTREGTGSLVAVTYDPSKVEEGSESELAAQPVYIGVPTASPFDAPPATPPSDRTARRRRAMRR